MVVPREVGRGIRQTDGCAGRLPLVYALELVGEADAFACYEASTFASGVRRSTPGVALATDVSSEANRLAFTRAISRVLARSDADVSAARDAFASADIDLSGTAAVRARSIRGCGVDTRAAERVLGDVLVERGLEVDLDAPEHVLRAVFSGDVATMGWLRHLPDADYADRAPTKRPFFQPGSMSPRLARALVNIAGVDPTDRVLDPMCGTGGTLIEAGRMNVGAVGIDAQRRMVNGTRRNCEALAPDGDTTLLQGDATQLPLVDGAVTAVVLDVPYGRQSHIAGPRRESIVEGALAEARRVAAGAVVVADRSIATSARAAGWHVRAHFGRRVHRSLVRHIHHLEPDE